MGILESELAGTRDGLQELAELRHWKAAVEASRSWQVISGLARVKRLPGRIRRALPHG